MCASPSRLTATTPTATDDEDGAPNLWLGLGALLAAGAAVGSVLLKTRRRPGDLAGRGDTEQGGASPDDRA